MERGREVLTPAAMLRLDGNSLHLAPQVSLRNLGDKSRAHTRFTHTPVAHLNVFGHTLTHTLVDLSAGGPFIGVVLTKL